MSFNIDIHCHSSSKPFMSGIDNQIQTAFESYDFNTDHPIYSLLKSQLAKFSKVLLRTQSNFDNLHKGGVRVAFVSLTPMERGFTAMNPKPVSFFKTIKKDLLEEASGYGIQFLSAAAINALTGYSKSDINIVKRAVGTIYEELFLKEIYYLSKHTNTTNQICTIRFPQNYAELAANLNDDRILNILANVEGAHSFGSFRLLPDLIGGVSNPHLKYDGNVITGSEICANLKAYRTDAQFPRLFSIGICHHFWNGLAGHARSLNGLIADVVSQDEGINSGLQPSGKMVIDAMALTEYDGGNVPRILLDIKHMSPLSRKEYYAYRKKSHGPIICSHTGITMTLDGSLDKWIAYTKKFPMEDEKQHYDADYLHEKAINLCREDLVQIYDSNGLIGIQLDEKRIMGPRAIEELKQKNKTGSQSEIKYVYAKVIWANIFCAVDELKRAGVADLRKAWDMICIGSDFDGLINHLVSFQTSAEMDSLKFTMGYFLEEPEMITLYNDQVKVHAIDLDNMEQLKCGYSNAELIHKIFSGNAMEFLKNNF